MTTSELPFSLSATQPARYEDEILSPQSQCDLIIARYNEDRAEIVVCRDEISSPCRAGCRASSGTNNFTQCGCVQAEAASAVRQLCGGDCGYFYPFLVVCFVLIFLTFWITMPSTMATLRSVREHERSMALGLQSVVIRLIGSIPGPVLFGYFIDRTCILWDKSCGKILEFQSQLYQ